MWPLSLHAPGPPLGSGPPCRDEGAQVSAAPQVQQARLSPRGQQVGPGSAGLQWGHYLWENKQGGERLSFTRCGPGICLLYPSIMFSSLEKEKRGVCFSPKGNPFKIPETLLTYCLFSHVPNKFPKVSTVDLPHFTDSSIARSCFIFNILLITFFPLSMWPKPMILTGVCILQEKGGACQKRGFPSAPTPILTCESGVGLKYLYF